MSAGAKLASVIKVVSVIKRYLLLVKSKNFAAVIKKRVALARIGMSQAIAKRVVTIDIDNTSIRLLEVKGRMVTRWGSVPLKPGDSSNQQSLAATIKQLMNACGIRTRHVIVGVSGLYSVSRILSIPNPPGGSSNPQAVDEAIRNAVSLDREGLYFSWQTITADADTRRVFFVGIPRDITDTWLRAVKAAGVSPRMLELRGIALTRVVQEKRALILHIEPSSFDVVIVANHVPEVMRTIAWEQDELTVEDKVEQLAAALELTVNFHNDRNPDNVIDTATPLFITGLMCGDPALMEELQARLRYPVAPLAPPLDYSESLPIYQYAANVGLALKGKSRNIGRGQSSPFDINLLPEGYRAWKPSTRQLSLAALAVGCVAVIFYLYQATAEVQSKNADLQVRQSILANELQRRQSEIKNRVPMQKAVEEFNTILAMRGSFTENLEVIYARAEEVGVQIKSVDYESKGVTVYCEASDYTAFRKYLAALESTSRFSSPIPPPEGYPFTTKGAIKFQPKPPAKTPTPTPTQTPAPK